jgi:hypothetical protein
MPKPRKVELNVVHLTPDVTVVVDIWAAAHALDRSAALSHLVELGLRAEAGLTGASRCNRDDRAIEARAANQIGLLIDPETPEEERERRIHRLTDGPPEFVDFRIDLPGRRPH